MVYTVQYMKYITRYDVKTGKNKVFVFGDNDQRSGFGGQAKEMRGEPNTVGIRVKKLPSMSDNAFYTDDEYVSNATKIAQDLEHLARIAYGKTIVFPEAGIGTGMAMLDQTAPKTFAYLSMALDQMFNIKNGDSSKHEKLYKEINQKLRPDRFNTIELKPGKFDIVEFRRKCITKKPKSTTKKPKCKCKINKRR
jgi:hypothetical protein